MNLLLIEDEAPAARQLTRLIELLRPEWTILDVIDSVETAVQWLRTFPHPDLLLMDIHLSDGISFDIFRQVQITSPVIFTTAYDEFTLRAFKVNSVDYLLKPIEADELKAALHKFEAHHAQLPTILPTLLTQFLAQINGQPVVSQPLARERLLVRQGAQWLTLPVLSLAYLYSDEGVTFAITADNKRHMLDFTLDEAEGLLPPARFFRISRKCIVEITAIKLIHTYFNSRLKLDLLPAPAFEVFVSRERVAEFKTWLDH